MKKATVKIPAKINLTLDIEGVKNGYHVLSSLVVSVDIYDKITVRPRKEDVISISFCGLPVGVNGKNSNAYFAADKFRREFSTGGVDICVERNIPAGAGLGGSSADMAGVLSAMKRLFDVKRDVYYIAENLGSDVVYMMNGGCAVMKDRGEIIEPISGVKRRLYFIIVTGTAGVSTGECYRGFDKQGKIYIRNTPIAVKLLQEDDPDNLFKVIKNDLYESAKTILPEIETTLERLKQFGEACMTGSGSAVYAVFKDKKKRDKAYKALLPEFGARLLKAQTV